MAGSTLKERIYRAQCFGNVEPIEYMVPYPNLGSLSEGQTLKHGNQILYHGPQITKIDFFKKIKFVGNWLTHNSVKPEDRVLIRNIPFPYAEILVFGIWAIGSSVILTSDDASTSFENRLKPKLIIDQFDPSIFQLSNEESLQFSSNKKPLLNSEALLYITDEKAIRLSHYNLLINAHGVQQLLKITPQTTIKINLAANSTTWAVLQAVLPLYSGASITDNGAALQISSKDSKKDADYIIEDNLSNISDSEPQRIYVLPEFTSVLSVGPNPNFLTSFELKGGMLKINGPSVMMGYLNDEANSEVFRDKAMLIKL
jgi:acyl-CoA synthetase (AMP-forming)/AMP-acid ligase II